MIKTGIKKINISYAKISFSDVAQKLQLDSPEDAEYIVAKVGEPFLWRVLEMDRVSSRPFVMGSSRRTSIMKRASSSREK